MRVWTAAFLLALCGFVVAGCGDDEKEEVRASIREFVRSIAARDYARVCGIVTKEVRADWAAFARRNPKHFSTAGCPAFAEDFYSADVSRRELRRDLRAIDRGDVTVDGDTATFTAHPLDRKPGRDDRTILKKVGGRWLLGD